MPFTSHGNRSFTFVSIDKNAPQASGVYGLSDSSQWLYVGETANIQAELLKHLRHPGALLQEHTPSGFNYELSSPEYRLQRQSLLVRELGPLGNR